MARSMVDTLTRENIQAACVSNVFRAVSAFTREPADLVVLGLKDLSEQDLLAINVIREVRNDCFVLVVFPAALRDRAVRALSHGADAYILEPFYPGEFLDISRRALSRFFRDEDTPPPGEDLERLAGAVAHAINNPLQILELLITESEGGSHETVNFRAVAERIKHVVEELLGFSQRTVLNLETLDLNELIHDELPDCTEGREVDIELSQDLPLILADRRGMRLVLRAFALLGAPGSLTVSTEHQKNGAKRPSVWGFHAPDLLLSATEKDAFFTPFAGAASGEVGLAAATARAVVEHHGGLVDLFSREGEGTRVVVSLPVRGER